MACAVHALRRDDLVEIFAERHRALGLLAVELDDVRQVLRIAQRDLDRRGSNALCRGVAAQAGQERGEIALAGPRPPQARTGRGKKRNRKDQPAAHSPRRH